MYSAIYEVLNDEQKQKVNEILLERKKEKEKQEEEKYIRQIQDYKKKKLQTRQENLSSAKWMGWCTIFLIITFCILFSIYIRTPLGQAVHKPALGQAVHKPVLEIFEHILSGIFLITIMFAFFTLILWAEAC
jgi:uncharacterized membrane protein